jgi:hypothetical protein
MSPFCAVFANISVHATAQEDQTPLDDGDAGMSTHQSCLSIPTIIFPFFLLQFFIRNYLSSYDGLPRYKKGGGTRKCRLFAPTNCTFTYDKPYMYYR